MVRRFPATAYLAPEPAQPFIELTQALARTFPCYPPFGGAHQSIVPHLTIANGDPAQVEVAASEMERQLETHGAIRAECASVTLLENSSGRWLTMHVLGLSQADR